MQKSQYLTLLFLLLIFLFFFSLTCVFLNWNRFLNIVFLKKEKKVKKFCSVKIFEFLMKKFYILEQMFYRFDLVFSWFIIQFVLDSRNEAPWKVLIILIWNLKSLYVVSLNKCNSSKIHILSVIQIVLNNLNYKNTKYILQFKLSESY